MIDADVRLRVTADTADADRRIEKTGSKLAAAGNGSGAPAAPAAGFSPGKLLGALAGGWVGGELLGIAQGMTYFTPGMDALAPGGQRRANRMGAVSGGLIAGAGAGAMLGSLIPGVGTAIGTAIGALAGALSGLAKTVLAEKKEFLQFQNDHHAGLEGIADAQLMGASKRAFDTLNARYTRPEQLERVKMRRQRIYGGVNQTYARMLELKRDGKDDGAEFKELAGIYALQKSELAGLLRQEENLRQPILGKRLTGSESLDTLARQGGTVGPTVDVAAVNRDQLRLEELQLQALKEIARVLGADTLREQRGAVYL